MNLDRRNFLKGAAIIGSTGALAGLAGCAPAGGKSAGEDSGISKERAAFEAATQPIAPVEPPASWDEETEVVIVGSGGGGMNTSIRLSQAGYQVLMLERGEETGGNSKHSSVFSNFGGHKQAEANKWAYPSYPYDVDSIVEFVMDCQQMTGDPD
ncbi:MAG: twin-arginine translocation signal domain-containing protein, partial [Gordonibacter sp.]